MFTNKSRINLEGVRRQFNLRNSLFIQKVKDEDRRGKILDNVFMQSTEENPYHKRILYETNLCAAIKEENRRKFLEDKRFQEIRANHLELKTLEEQLRAAYVSKTIAAQKFENKQLEVEKRARAVLQNNVLEQARLCLNESAKQRVLKEREKKRALKEDLLEQIAEMDAKRLHQKLCIVKEKEMLDAIVKKQREEELNEARMAFEKKMQVKKAMEDCIKMQEDYKIAQSQASEAEHQRVQEQNRLNELERQKLIQAKKDLKKRKDEISEEIGKRCHKIAIEKMKSFDKLTELLIDERKAKEEMKQRREQNQQMLNRTIIRNDMDYFRKEQERRKQVLKKDEEEIFRLQNVVLAEKDRLQRLADEKKKQKKDEHRHALQFALDEKKRLRAEEMKTLLLANKNDIEMTRRDQELLEMARGRMIKEHAPALKGFLPLRMLRPSDKEYLSIPSK